MCSQTKIDPGRVFDLETNSFRPLSPFLTTNNAVALQMYFFLLDLGLMFSYLKIIGYENCPNLKKKFKSSFSKTRSIEARKLFVLKLVFIFTTSIVTSLFAQINQIWWETMNSYSFGGIIILTKRDLVLKI